MIQKNNICKQAQIHGFPTAGDIYAYGATIETVENFCYLRSYIINHWELWARSQCVNRQSSWRFLKTRQIMEEQENQFASENKALWSASLLHVAQQYKAVASLSHPNEKKNSNQHTTDGNKVSWGFPGRTK